MRKLIYICSPYRGDIAGNTKLARDLCRRAIEHGYTPLAPHLLYPQFLDEADPAQRSAGLRCGLDWLQVCDEVWVYAPGDGEYSEGMRWEIFHAECLNKPVVHISFAWMRPEQPIGGGENDKIID